MPSPITNVESTTDTSASAYSIINDIISNYSLEELMFPIATSAWEWATENNEDDEEIKNKNNINTATHSGNGEKDTSSTSKGPIARHIVTFRDSWSAKSTPYSGLLSIHLPKETDILFERQELRLHDNIVVEQRQKVWAETIEQSHHNPKLFSSTATASSVVAEQKKIRNCINNKVESIDYTKIMHGSHDVIKATGKQRRLSLELLQKYTMQNEHDGVNDRMIQENSQKLANLCYTVDEHFTAVCSDYDDNCYYNPNNNYINNNHSAAIQPTVVRQQPFQEPPHFDNYGIGWSGMAFHTHDEMENAYADFLKHYDDPSKCYSAWVYGYPMDNWDLSLLYDRLSI